MPTWQTNWSSKVVFYFLLLLLFQVVSILTVRTQDCSNPCSHKGFSNLKYLVLLIYKNLYYNETKNTSYRWLIFLYPIICIFYTTKTYLDEPVEWKYRQDELGRILHNGKQSKHHPVCQPLCIILFVFGFNSLHWFVCGVKESYAVTDNLSCIAKDQV